MINTTPLHFSYSGNQRFEFPSLVCEPGDSLLLLGPSGSGKTTWMHLLCGLLKPSSGTIFINNIDISTLSEAKLDQFRGKHIATMLQKPVFYRSLSVKENLETCLYFAGKEISVDIIKRNLENLNLFGKLNSKINELSHGELQRLAFVRAVLLEPSLILADEPTASLDNKNAENIASLFLQQANIRNTTLLIITHDQRLKNMFHSKIEIA